jgi:thiamine kinase-like enzyme
LFKGYADFFNGLIDREGTIVLGHNDTQENNILIGNEDNEKMILIDFEYGGFNPITYDIANYLNETVCDNQSMRYYHSNFPGA